MQFFLPKSPSNVKNDINVIIKDDHDETIFSSKSFSENTNTRVEDQVFESSLNDTSSLFQQTSSLAPSAENASACRSVRTESSNTLPRNQSAKANEKYQSDFPCQSSKQKASLKSPFKKITRNFRRKFKKV